MDAEERNRIYETGGFVRYNRVNGNLALSRAFGDFGEFLKTSIQRCFAKFRLKLRSQAEF